MAGGDKFIGKRLGSYNVHKKLGSGGFGHVYEGKHIYLDSIVAIKVLNPEHISDEHRKMLISEATTLKKLKHRYILPLIDVSDTQIDVSDTQGVLYMVMEYASGGTLQDRLRRHLSLQEGLSILYQIGQALHFAHQQEVPIVHRDLKPANILFNERGEALLADFGLATALTNRKTMRVENVAGTFEYMAPEQFLGDVSVKSDQYALGCIAYELLTGQYPFDIPNTPDYLVKGAILYAQHNEVIPKAPVELNPQIPLSISDAILKAMAKNRDERHEDVLTFINILQQHLPQSMAGGGEFIGKQLGSYHIRKKLGSGGFGTVYEGEHKYLHSVVAIKVLHAKHISKKDSALLMSEAITLQKLKHQHILSLIDVGEMQDFVYMVTKYAPGGSLRDRLDGHPNQPLPLQESLSILSQLGQALHYIHHQVPPIVHRDLKPANILFNENGEALLADFGLATPLLSTNTEIVDEVGTPLYMAPEQFENKVSAKSDQYALGCIAYELLTGQHPFPVSKVALKHYHQSIAPKAPVELNPQIPLSISDAILKAMAKNRNDRHKDVLAFINILQPQQLSKTFEQWYVEGNTLFEHKQYAAAIKAYQQASLLKPNFADVYVNIGISRYNLKQYEEAVTAFEQALGYQRGHGKAHYYKGLSLSELRQYVEAAEAYRRTIRYQTDHQEAHRDLADTLAELGQYEQAVAAYERAVELNPDDADIYNDLGTTCRKCGKWKKALQAFEHAIQLNPRLEKAYYNKGNTHYECHEYTEALLAYEYALHLQPRFANAYYGKSNALRQLGRLDEAKLAEKQAYQHGYTG